MDGCGQAGLSGIHGCHPWRAGRQHLVSRPTGLRLPGQSMAVSSLLLVSETWCQRLCQRDWQLQNVCVWFCRRGGVTEWKYLMQTPWEASRQDVASEENTNSWRLCNLALFWWVLHSGVGTREAVLRTKSR